MLLAHACPRRGGVEGVEQFGQRYRGRARLTGVLVGAGVGDHQRLGRRADRVEQQLAVLGADVALTGHRFAGQHVVAVDHADPREDVVVEADQAHHPVRHRAHRHHGAHRQRAGAEVGPGGPAGQVPVATAAWMSGSRSTRLPRERRPWPARRLNSRSSWLICQASASSTRVSAVMPSASVLSHCAQRLGAGERLDDVLQPCRTNSASRPGQFDAVAADVVQRQRGADPGVRIVGHRDPGQDAIEAEPPGVVDEVDVVGLAVVLVEPPADVGLTHPVGDVLAGRRR